MSYWAPQTNKESRALARLLENPVEIAAIHQRLANHDLVRKEVVLRRRVRDLLLDPELAMQHRKNKINLYEQSGVQAAAEALAEEYQVPIWSIRTMPYDGDFPYGADVSYLKPY